MIKDFYNTFINPKLKNSELYLINGNKDIYNCFVNNIKRFVNKFKINMEQSSNFLSNIFPNSDKIGIFRTINNLNDNKKLKPFINIFQEFN